MKFKKIKKTKKISMERSKERIKYILYSHTNIIKWYDKSCIHAIFFSSQYGAFKEINGSFQGEKNVF